MSETTKKHITKKEIKGKTYIIESIEPGDEDKKVIKKTVEKLLLNNIEDVKKEGK